MAINSDQELTPLRTLNSKTFVQPDGKRRLVISRTQIHYVDRNGELQEANPTWRQTDEAIECGTAPYDISIHKNGVGFDVVSKSGGSMSAVLLSVGGTAPIRSEPIVSGDIVMFPSVATDTDIIFRLLPAGVKSLRVVRSAMAPRVFVWQVDCDDAGKEKIDRRFVGFDAAGRRLDLSRDAVVGQVTEKWGGKTITLDQNTRVKSLSDDVVYPVTIDPSFSESIPSDNDDVWEKRGNYQGGVLTEVSDNTYAYGYYGDYVGLWGVTNYSKSHAGWRFTNVTIPQGATVTSATLSVYVNYLNGTGAAGVIYGYATDNAAAWSIGTNPGAGTVTPARVVLTTATTSFSRPSTGSHSYDVATIVQELINRAGWASGNALSFVVKPNEAPGPPAPPITAFADTSDVLGGSNKPSISIVYSTGAVGAVLPRRSLRVGNLLRM